VEQELGEDGALLWAAERQLHPLRDRLQRPENLEFRGPTPLLSQS
jgi:hypothetical protein